MSIKSNLKNNYNFLKNNIYNDIYNNMYNKLLNVNSNTPKKYQHGGTINNDHAYPVSPILKDQLGFQELQTEIGEVALLPNGNIVDVKADKRHKNQDKNNITDYFQEDTYIFSRDPKMKFGPKSKILGVNLDDMSLGKSNFKYKENEYGLDDRPKDIMVSDVFFGKNPTKKEITTADMARNIKKTFPLIDMRDDVFADKAIEENKEQRLLYGEILKTFAEYKKPKNKKADNQKAQYGMLSKINSSPYKNLAYSEDLEELINRPFNYGSTTNYKPINKAQFGFLGEGVDALFGFSERAKRNQEAKNRILSREAQGYRNDLQNAVDKAGMLNMGTNMATYAAALNVPLQKYDDQNEQQSIFNSGINRSEKRLNASKYLNDNAIGGASSMARYMNGNNYGAYLGNVQSQSNSMAANINQQLANLDTQRAQGNIGFITAREAAKNNALNTRDTQLYNANITGLTNVGKSAQESVYNSGSTKYQLGLEKLAYDDFLEQKALREKQRVNAKVVNITNEIAGLAASAGLGAAGVLGPLEGGKGAMSGVAQYMGFPSATAKKDNTTKSTNTSPSKPNGFNPVNYLPYMPIDTLKNPPPYYPGPVHFQQSPALPNPFHSVDPYYGSYPYNVYKKRGPYDPPY